MNSGGGSFGDGLGNATALQTLARLVRDVSARNSLPGGSWLILASSILPVLFMMWIFQGGVRQRIIAAGFGMIVATMAMTGCDPCPSCADAKLKSTVQTLVAVSVTDTEGNQLSVTGIPVNLSQLSI
jgi:hypothetical protein